MPFDEGEKMMANRLTWTYVWEMGRTHVFFWEIRRMKKQHQDLTTLIMDQRTPHANGKKCLDGMESVKTFQHTL